LSSSVEDMIIKECGFLEDAHLLWNDVKEKFSEITAARDSVDGDCLTKPVRPVGQTDQTGQAKTATSKLQKSKSHRLNEDSTSQTISLSYKSHGKCLMAKGKKKKKFKEPLDFDHIFLAYLVKIKIEELKALNEEHEKLNHSHNSLIDKHEKLEKDYACATNVSSCIDPLEEENANFKTQLEVLTSKHVKMNKDHDVLKCSHDNLQDALVMLQVSHKVVVTSVKHFQSST
jgi:hypothetical protein